MSNDLQMYGVNDINAFFESVKNCATYKITGGFMVVAGLMSDAQEMIAYNSPEQARQTLNRAKYLQFKIAAGELDFAKQVETY
jgi:hypothetical protein